MADELIVRHGSGGKVTVCFGELCVVVDCAGASAEPEDPVPVHEDPSPPYRMLLRDEALADLAGEELEWTDVGENARTAEHRGERIWQHRLDA